MNTTQWKEKITEWLNAEKLEKKSFLLIECKECKKITYVRVSLLLDMYKLRWECSGCGCKYWRLKTTGLGEWERSGKCQFGLLSADKDTKFSA